MNTTAQHLAQHLTVDEASRLAVTATTADLEQWAHIAAVHGQVALTDLVEVLALMRTESLPQQRFSVVPPLAAS